MAPQGQLHVPSLPYHQPKCVGPFDQIREVQYSVPQGKAEQTSALPELDDKAREEVDPDEVEGEKDKPSKGEEEEDDITKAKEPR